VVPGPVASSDAPPEDVSAKKQQDSAAIQPTTRSMGRFRRGSLGGSGAPPAAVVGSRPEADGGPVPAEPTSDEPGPDTVTGLTSEQADLVEKMARGYQGVGRRTAERLFEEFGDQVLDVIDNEPGRIESVLPKGRAQAVIDGRRAEREGNRD